MFPEPDSSPRCFVTTHWSVVLAAKQGTTKEVDAALGELCGIYWRPLYYFIRRRGHSPHDAQDLTQEFFARLLARDFLRTVDRSKGKFRSFLLGALEHFLAKEWRRSQTQKRGGQFTIVSTDAESAEQQYLQVPATDLSPDQLYEKQWAITLFCRALDQLKEEFVRDEKEAEFEAMKIFLTGEERAASYAKLAAKLGMTEGALKMARRRMLDRHLELLRAEIAKTVNDPAEIDEELRALSRALRL